MQTYAISGQAAMVKVLGTVRFSKVRFEGRALEHALAGQKGSSTRWNKKFGFGAPLLRPCPHSWAHNVAQLLWILCAGLLTSKSCETPSTEHPGTSFRHL